MESPDPRRQRSRAALLAAFFDQVLRLRYDQISIAGLIAQAGVARSTFYEHFDSKDSLLAESLQFPLAPLADQFVLQIQRVQEQPGVAADFVDGMTTALRAANPDLEISVQVRTDGDPAQVAALVDTLADEIDGVAILTRPDGVDEAERMVAAIRPEAATNPPDETAPVADTTPPRWGALFLGLGLELFLLLALMAAIIFIGASVAVTRQRR